MEKIATAYCSFVVLLLVCFGANAQTPPLSHHFIKIDSGTYTVGAAKHPLNPKRKIVLSAFSIANKETTNEQFEQFVKATGYITDAEAMHDALTFYPGLEEFEWAEDSTANWRFPFGAKQEGIANKMNHPVTCISYSDAVTYCQWAGVRLPTLNEWEVSSRAGSNEEYYWGKDKTLITQYANIWTGKNHLTVANSEKHIYSSPVGLYRPNKWGLYDIYGNVFEFCSDKPPLLQNVKNIACARGGSWWCSSHACNFFNSVDIGRVNIHASFSNQGFRVVRDAK